jgi:hypothetical protein
MWDFQHTSSLVVGGHPNQYVQQIGDDGPQPIGHKVVMKIGLLVIVEKINPMTID